MNALLVIILVFTQKKATFSRDFFLFGQFRGAFSPLAKAVPCANCGQVEMRDIGEGRSFGGGRGPGALLTCYAG
jgi:hypothetical protein